MDDPVGEVSIQIDLYTHPGTGEHKVTVKGMVKHVLLLRLCDCVEANLQLAVIIFLCYLTGCESRIVFSVSH